jgi:uncharacterized protein (UPF0335 family)
MKAATQNDIKKELQTLTNEQLLDICLRLCRFKKENKELTTYILFDAANEDDYIQSIKAEIDDQFAEINSANLYWAKKSLRKILRQITKQSRYSGITQTTIELLIYYCLKLKQSGIQYEKSPVLKNLYQSQLKKIEKEMSSLHEDLQYDYKKQLSLLAIE